MADIIAVIFDFDDTLAPDSTTKLLRSRGIDTDRFWRKDVSALVEQGWDASHAWLRLLLDNVGPDKPLGELTNSDLRELVRPSTTITSKGFQRYSMISRVRSRSQSLKTSRLSST